MKKLVNIARKTISVSCLVLLTIVGLGDYCVYSKPEYNPFIETVSLPEINV